MDHVDAREIQRDKVKYEVKDEAIGSSVPRKSSKRSKSKKRKSDKKEKKKHKKKCKRKRSSSSSESDASDHVEWVERTDEDRVSLPTEKLVMCKAQESRQISKRDEWMNVESFVPYLSKPMAKLQNVATATTQEEKVKILPDKPGQSDRELNPHWKDGGDGLPQDNTGKSDNPKILDATWLKRSLWRAEEQARRDGKDLEEVAAERWGSLEIIQTMISEAERAVATARQTKSYSKGSHNDRNDKDSHGISGLRIRKRSRSRSKSRDCTDYSSQCRTESKLTYQRPRDNDDYYLQQTTLARSRTRNWKKDKSEREKGESQVIDCPPPPVAEPKEVDSRNVNSTTEIAKDKDIGADVFTEAEMNKLGARIIKAELMGDDDVAAQLKIQLEHARKHVAACNDATTAQEASVILARTDAKGTVRPIQPRSQFPSKRENYKRKKTVETHVSGERVRHFADDDKYSLREMFQREKGRSTTEDEAVFAKLASRRMDHMDDVFERQITRTASDARLDELDRTQAIKEHRDLSKRMDTCWWCVDSKNMLKHMVVTMDSAICLSLPAFTSLTSGHCILTPVQHVACQLQLDEDVWDRLKELKRNVRKMFTEEDLYPIFFEVYKRRCKFSHMQLECVPLPKEIGELAPVYFKKALLECETEWAINKKIVDLTDKDIRHAIPNGLSYFTVEFASHPGYAHVIETEEMFPQNFAKEIIGGMLDLDHNLWRKPKRQSFEEQRVKVLEFTEKWKKYNSSFVEGR